MGLFVCSAAGLTEPQTMALTGERLRGDDLD